MVAPAAEAAALGAIVGHCFPVWLRFRGGKEVATLMGVSLGLSWPVGLVYAVVWIAMLATTQISSLAGMSAAVSAPLAAFVFAGTQTALVLAVLALLVIVLHRSNISRLVQGTEPRIGKNDKA